MVFRRQRFDLFSDFEEPDPDGVEAQAAGEAAAGEIHLIASMAPRTSFRRWASR
jgi:hypothetical protein